MIILCLQFNKVWGLFRNLPIFNKNRALCCWLKARNIKPIETVRISPIISNRLLCFSQSLAKDCVCPLCCLSALSISKTSYEKSQNSHTYSYIYIYIYVDYTYIHMEDRKRVVLFETRRHASRPYSSNYPPIHHQLNEGAKSSFLSLLSTRGLFQLKERWNEYRHPRRLRKCSSLFVSASSDRVAVASGSQITILRKDDGYREPCGTFTGGSKGTFIHGTWSEAHDILGITDDTDTIYFIKADGEEIMRITKSHLKMSLPIIGLIVQDDSDKKKSCLCTFSIVTSDGLLHHIEISADPNASIVSTDPFISGSLLKEQLSQNVFCMDYYPKLSLFAVVSATGSTRLMPNHDTGCNIVSLWRISGNLDAEHLVSAQLEGLYSKPKDYVGQLTSSKVLISPQGNYVASLDMRGCLLIFKFDDKQCSFSKLFDDLKNGTEVMPDISRGGEYMIDIVDFAWWSDDIITVAKRSGNVTMFEISSGVKVLDNDSVYSMPLLERAQQLSGHLFLLESTSSEVNGASNLHHTQHVVDNRDHSNFDGWQWSLFSFSERSIPEMFHILISNQEYQAAFDFASCHGLDKDEVVKSQWLHSVQGVNEINTFLSSIKDPVFVLSECVNQVGPTEDAVRSLLALGLQLTDRYRFSVSEDDECNQIWDFRVARLKLLQFRDRLETFLGINMGRFAVQEYKMFRNLPIKEPAVSLAESGKIGALNLLFKRHFYSLAPSMLEVLAAIPETIPVQSYGQLLPGSSPPSIALREEDWVECHHMVSFINRHPENDEISIHVRTEHIVKQCNGFHWPLISELSLWYKNRARDIDTLSGLLDNCMCLIELACKKGISELQQFLEDISYLHQLIYSNDSEDGLNFSISLIAWEQLPDYEKFKLMLMGIKEENVIDRLDKRAIPFMQKRFHSPTMSSRNTLMDNHFTIDNEADSFLIRWLEEIAGENKLDMCLLVIEEGCRDIQNSRFFRDELEVVDCALQCIYLCSATDKWSTMASILYKLPHLQDFVGDDIKRRLKLAEGHIEAGRLLAIYQVPKPISFFLEAPSDEKGVKQILRLILSKLIRRQTGRSDNDWANVWRDLQSLQEKAFPFLDMEYLLIEFCRGLLKAGKFSLARNYLKGAGSVALAAEKAESLVIQAAREYFFSASSLSCSDIWKAKECLNIFPNRRNVRAEADIIDAVTVKLPNLGVNLLPMQFRQIKDPMEIIKLAITSQPGAYLNVDELIEIAKLLGLSSQDDISAVQEAIAREAAVAGDLQLAFDLCLVLARKGHGSVWDLCAALARGPALDNMDISSRKLLLGFALSHCDEESIGELLNAWKDLDLQGQCDTLAMLTGKEPPKFLIQGSSIKSYPLHSSEDMVGLRDWSGQVDGVDSDDQVAQFDIIKKILLQVAKNVPADNAHDWESLLRENGKLSSFAALRLPWLLELSQGANDGQKSISISVSGKQYISVRTQVVVTILSWLARNGFAPRDDLIVSLAKSIMEPPVTEDEDLLGCSFLLNLEDALYGVKVIEEHVRKRENYSAISSIMNVGMIYGLLHSCGAESEDPSQRRELLLRKFQQRNNSINSDERDKFDEAQSTFWREWKLKLEEQKRVADQTKELEQIIPGVETARFLSGDLDYIESVVSSLTETVKVEKKPILKDVLKLANSYGLDQSKVLLHFVSSVLVSEVWTIEDIMAEVSDFREEILMHAAEFIKVLCSVYSAIDGLDKRRLAYIYDLLSDCYLQLEEREESLPIMDQDSAHSSTLGLASFCKILEKECSRVSFIKALNFKNIAGLHDLNFDCFNSEVCAHIDETNVEALAKMVQNLVGALKDPVPEGLLSWQSVYTYYMQNMLTSLDNRAKSETHVESPDYLLCFISELEHTYDICRRYIRLMEIPGLWDVLKRFFTIILHVDKSSSLSCNAAWQECLIMLLNFWLKVMNDMQEVKMDESLEERFSSECAITCVKSFLSLVINGKFSSSQGWGTICAFVNYGLKGCLAVEIYNFCRAMILSGCGFEPVANVFSDAMAQLSPGCDMSIDAQNVSVSIQDLPHLYLSILESILQEFAVGSLQRENLHNLISSLSKLEGDLEGLNRVRLAVWEKMVDFSSNLQLPSHVRVYVLELMQFIADADRLQKGNSELDSYVSPWEGWENFRSKTATGNNTTKDGLLEAEDATSRFTNTLIALKSSQLVSIISQSLEITPEDLSTVESAVSCFRRVSEVAVSESHIDALLAMLREWENLFTSRKTEIGSPAVSDFGNSWNNDDWDEGWESFQDEPVEKETNKDVLSIHPLHACWMLIFRKLVMLSRFENLIKLIDQFTAQTSQILLDEDDACSLSQTLLEVDCILALKLALLLPYEAVRLLCLDALENKLKHEGISDNIGEDRELFVLVLSSGIVSTVITKSSYGTTFSYLCYMVGNFSRQCQEAELSSLKHGVSSESEKSAKNLVYLFARLLFPCFLSELVKEDQQILAGFLVTKFMHCNTSLSLISVAEASLRRYLERQLQILQQDDESGWEDMEFGLLSNTISGLRHKLGNVIQSSLSLLPTDVR